MSSAAAFLLGTVFRYRARVVAQNLHNAFPEQNAEWRKAVAQRFYKQFTDVTMEILHTSRMRLDDFARRVTIEGVDELNRLSENRTRSVIVLTIHQGNWEWIAGLPLYTSANIFGSYKHIRNAFFNNLVTKTRSKFGITLFESKQIVKAIHRNFSTNKHGAYVLISDQSPMLTKKMYWSNFFNVKVPIHTGAEAMAKKFDLVVLNWSVTKIKRGYYNAEFTVITEKPKEEEKNFITEKYLELTENQIKKQPECYLWSHKRFKHKDRFEDWQKENL